MDCFTADDESANQMWSSQQSQTLLCARNLIADFLEVNWKSMQLLRHVLNSVSN
jgi:hypothetical protein